MVDLVAKMNLSGSKGLGYAEALHFSTGELSDNG